MPDRQEILRQYQELQVFLNRSNKTPNLKTEYVFRLKVNLVGITQLFACVESEFDKSTFLMAQHSKNFYWRPTDDFQFDELKEYCCKILNSKTYDLKNLNEIETNLNQELRSLRF